MVLHRLHDDGFVYDAILACGNTGLFMAEVLRLYFGEMGWQYPEVVALPILRFEDHEKHKLYEEQLDEMLRASVQVDPVKAHPEIFFDNRVLLPWVKEKYGNMKELKRILFVDDEILTGFTVRTGLHILQEIGIASEDLHVTIVAENHGFRWYESNCDMLMTFAPYGVVEPTLGYNIITSLFSESQMRQLHACISCEMKDQSLVNAVLGLPVKGFDGKVPFWNEEPAKELTKHCAGYEELREQVVGEILRK